MASRAVIKVWRDQVMTLLESYAFNGMEVCRAVNGYGALNHKGCHYTVKEIPWGGGKGGCRYRHRGCEMCQKTVLDRLKSMERAGLIHSIKIRWFDSREPGAAGGGYTLDFFRFFYSSKEGLSRKLHQDIEVKIMGVERRLYTVHGRQYWITFQELLEEVPADEAEECWEVMEVSS